MLKHILTLALTLAPAIASAATLTELEKRWLTAAGPVLAYARQINLPIDITVQPVARPDDVALAMGFLDGRCKLVVSMRGNPNAEKVLDGVPESQQAILIEAMAAHEVAHCWRKARGQWNALPSGFFEDGAEIADPALLAEMKQMRERRREEGFSDLVALAWTKRRHPESYARVHAWLASVRADQPVTGGGHDTRVWVELAKDSAAIDTAATPFDDVGRLWSRGLLSDE
ncbi:MAG: hypothetical protein V4723_11600 [Pseudomonadota bacterium]